MSLFPTRAGAAALAVGDAAPDGAVLWTEAPGVFDEALV